MKVIIILLAIYILIRYFIPLLIRMIFINAFKTAKKKSDSQKATSKKKQKTNEKYGEYIDYEDID